MPNTPSALEAIRGKMEISTHTYDTFRRAAIQEELDQERNVVVFAAKFEKNGLSVVVR